MTMAAMIPPDNPEAEESDAEAAGDPDRTVVGGIVDGDRVGALDGVKHPLI